MPEVRDHFRKLIQLRRAHPALRTGDFQPLLADDRRELLAYSRRSGDETILVVINNGSRPQVVDLESGSALQDLLDGSGAHPSREGKVQVPVAAGWGAVLRKQPGE